MAGKQKKSTVKKKASSKAIKSVAKKPKKVVAKHAKKSPKTKKFVYISVAVFMVVLLVGGIVIGYKVYQQKKIDKYESLVYEIKTQTNQAMAGIDSYVQSDITSASAYAKKYSKKFREAAGTSERAVLALKTVEAQTDSQRNELDELIKSYEKSESLYRDLAVLSDYIVRRNGTLQSLTKEFEAFIATTSKPRSRRRRQKWVPVRELADKVAAEMKSVLVEIKALKSPAAIYEDKMVAKYARNLAGQLKELDEVLLRGRTTKIKSAIKSYETDYIENWQPDFNKMDEKVLSSLSDTSSFGG